MSWEVISYMSCHNGYYAPCFISAVTIKFTNSYISMFSESLLTFQVIFPHHTADDNYVICQRSLFVAFHEILALLTKPSV